MPLRRQMKTFIWRMNFPHTQVGVNYIFIECQKRVEKQTNKNTKLPLSDFFVFIH